MTVQNSDDLLKQIRELSDRIKAGELDTEMARQQAEKLGDDILESSLSGVSDLALAAWENLCEDADYGGDIVLAHLQDLKEKTVA